MSSLAIIDDGMHRCHRHGYVNITSQACMEKSSTFVELCGSCGNRTKSVVRLADVIPGGFHRIDELARSKKLSFIADPFIPKEDKPYEGRPGENRMNRIKVYINGVLMLSTVATVKLQGGHLAKDAHVEFDSVTIKGKKIGTVIVERYTNGKLQSAYEWVRPLGFEDVETGMVKVVAKQLQSLPD